MSVEFDRAGTVRRSADGVVAVLVDNFMGSERKWVTTQDTHAEIWRWRSDDSVKDWEVVYVPPVPEVPIGTLMYRQVGTQGAFEVAVKTTKKGWSWCPSGYGFETPVHQGEAPFDDAEGVWTTIQILP